MSNTNKNATVGELKQRTARAVARLALLLMFAFVELKLKYLTYESLGEEVQ